MYIDEHPTRLNSRKMHRIGSCVLQVLTFLILTLALETASAQEESDNQEPSTDATPSNIESWDEEPEAAPTWFGMGFESRTFAHEKPGQQSTERVVNNW